MKRTNCIVLCALFMVVMMSGVAISAEKQAREQNQGIIITGTVTDANQLADNDGEIFSVAENEQGTKLLSHVDRKIQVREV